MIFGSFFAPSTFEDKLRLFEARGPQECALTQNIRYDDRVTAERASEFLKLGDTLPIADALRRYARENVRQPKPAFLNAHLNRSNMYPANRWGRHQPDPRIHLVRAINVNFLRKILIEWKDRLDAPAWVRGMGLRGSNISAESLHIKIDSLFGGAGEDGLPLRPGRATDFAALLVSFLNQLLDDTVASATFDPEIPPTWVTTWHSFKPYVENSPARWAEVLGVGHWYPPFWILLLRYPAYVAGDLARPTQLEADVNFFHFPTMRNVEVSRGGHPADLRALHGKLLPEWLHSAVVHQPSHVLRCGEVKAWRSEDLGTIRGKHYAKLCSDRYYGKTLVGDWMPQQALDDCTRKAD